MLQVCHNSGCACSIQFFMLVLLPLSAWAWAGIVHRVKSKASYFSSRSAQRKTKNSICHFLPMVFIPESLFATLWNSSRFVWSFCPDLNHFAYACVKLYRAFRYWRLSFSPEHCAGEPETQFISTRFPEKLNDTATVTSLNIWITLVAQKISLWDVDRVHLQSFPRRFHLNLFAAHRFETECFQVVRARN